MFELKFNEPLIFEILTAQMCLNIFLLVLPIEDHIEPRLAPACISESENNFCFLTEP